MPALLLSSMRPPHPAVHGSTHASFKHVDTRLAPTELTSVCCLKAVLLCSGRRWGRQASSSLGGIEVLCVVTTVT
jgi:hypothetical protein